MLEPCEDCFWLKNLLSECMDADCRLTVPDNHRNDEASYRDDAIANIGKSK